MARFIIDNVQDITMPELLRFFICFIGQLKITVIKGGFNICTRLFLLDISSNCCLITQHSVLLHSNVTSVPGKQVKYTKDESYRTISSLSGERKILPRQRYIVLRFVLSEASACFLAPRLRTLLIEQDDGLCNTCLASLPVDIA